ncbi:MAG: LD-carboxypeptidase [Acidobacteria bacterium]|nr:LD-carboxypeptidase [Acidobacteriota bacterium]
MRKPRALQPGDRIAIIAPASSASTEELQAGAEELRTLGYEPHHHTSLSQRSMYTAGPAKVRADALRSAWSDPSIAAIVAARGGYGSVQLLPLLKASEFAETSKAFIGYSDNTSLLAWLTLTCGIVTFHGPMIDARLARGPAGYDRDTFERCLARPAVVGRITHPQLEVVRPGEASGMLIGGTMTQLAASLGTPYAFDPPQGCVLFCDEVAERPYRVDRLFTQLAQAGVIARASALVFGEMPRCDEPAGNVRIRDVVIELTATFPGPVLFGLPSGHTSGPTLTLPFGVRARVVAGSSPALVIEEAAVV